MKKFSPQFIIEQFNKKNHDGSLVAFVIVVDVTGFTRMTQSLMTNGKEGAEVLASVINSVFTPAIELIQSQSGFVSSFAGDAFTALFPEETSTISHVFWVAGELQKLFSEMFIQRTEFGEFHLSLRVGSSFGTVLWKIVPGKGQNICFFYGNAITDANSAQQEASANEVVFHESVVSNSSELSGLTFNCKSSSFYSAISGTDALNFKKKILVNRNSCVDDDPFVSSEISLITSSGEFREIVSCFVKIKNSSNLEADVKQVSQLLDKYGGYFDKIDFSSGYGLILAVFGAPVNEGQIEVRALSFALEVNAITNLSLGIGLSSGTAFAGFVGSNLRGEYTVLGSVVNRAARFTQLDEFGNVYIDKKLAENSFNKFVCELFSEEKIKGFDEPLSVYKITGRNEIQFSPMFKGDLVGRAYEMEFLIEAIQPLKDGESAGVFYIFGASGVGKSRLVHELELFSEYQSYLFHADSILIKQLNPFVSFFSSFFNQRLATTLAEKRISFDKEYERVVSRVKENVLNISSEERVEELIRIRPFIASVIGLSAEKSLYDNVPKEDRALVIQLAIADFLLALSLVEPVIFVIEDFEWLDIDSRQVFTTLLRQLLNHPIILIACGRDGSGYLLNKFDIEKNVSSEELVLEELSLFESKQLIEDRLSYEVDEDLSHYIHGRTDGNPFYIEQFCLYLLENDLIKFDGSVVKLSQELIEIPPDITKLLVARIDQLSVKLKETVQTASVLGRGFNLQILAVLTSILKTELLTEVSSDFFENLQKLVDAIEDDGIWLSISSFDYIFSNSLLRETAYDMQLRSQLRAMHEVSAKAILIVHSDNKAIYADCAYHFDKSQNWKNAIEYYLKAAEYSFENLVFGKARDYQKKSLEILLDNYKDDSLQIADCYEFLGKVEAELGDYNASLNSYEEVYNLRVKLNGEKHFDSARALNNIGYIHRLMGEYDSALKSHISALAIWKEIDTSDSLEIAQVFYNVGSTYQKMGEYLPSLEYHGKALAIREKLLGEEHLDVAESLNSIGIVYRYQDKLDNTLDLYKQALSIRLEILGDEHPVTASSYHNIGFIYWYKGDQKQAIKYLEKALQICEKTLGSKHPNTASALNTIGGVYWREGDYNKALSYQFKALTIREAVFGSNHPETAESYNNIGTSFVRKTEHTEALIYLNKALSVWEKLLGEKHPHTAQVYNNVGVVSHRNGDLKKALSILNKSLEIRLELLGDNHQSIAESYKNIGAVYKSMKKNGKAKELLDKSVGIFIDSLGENHPQTLEALKLQKECN